MYRAEYNFLSSEWRSQQSRGSMQLFTSHCLIERFFVSAFRSNADDQWGKKENVSNPKKIALPPKRTPVEMSGPPDCRLLPCFLDAARSERRFARYGVTLLRIRWTEQIFSQSRIDSLWRGTGGRGHHNKSCCIAFRKKILRRAFRPLTFDPRSFVGRQKLPAKFSNERPLLHKCVPVNTRWQ